MVGGGGSIVAAIGEDRPVAPLLWQVTQAGAKARSLAARASPAGSGQMLLFQDSLRDAAQVGADAVVDAGEAPLQRPKLRLQRTARRAM